MGVVVVLLTGSECEEYPGCSCVMEVLGLYDTREEAAEVAGDQPGWTALHIMSMHQDGR